MLHVFCGHKTSTKTQSRPYALNMEAGHIYTKSLKHSQVPQEKNKYLLDPTE